MRYLFLLLIALTGCSQLIPAPENPRIPQNLPAAINSHLMAPANFVFARTKEEKTSTTWQVSSSNFGLEFQYFKKMGGSPRDLVIIFNILKDKNQTVSGWLTSNLLAAGYNCVIIQQEDFLSRKKLRLIKPDRDTDLLDWNSYFALNLQHLALIIREWIPQQPELTGRYSFVGVSMGGILATASAACFPESQISIAVMAGGDNYALLTTSEESLVSSNFQRLIRHYMTKYSCTQEEARSRIKTDLDSLDFSILGLARCVQTQKMRQIISLYDNSVPTESQWTLNASLGSPETRCYPSGHISLGIFAWSVRDQIIFWLQEANPVQDQ